jgi:predicted NUDIX family NTP pyrophosphohydrolase
MVDDFAVDVFTAKWIATSGRTRDFEAIGRTSQYRNIKGATTKVVHCDVLPRLNYFDTNLKCGGDRLWHQLRST